MGGIPRSMDTTSVASNRFSTSRNSMGWLQVGLCSPNAKLAVVDRFWGESDRSLTGIEGQGGRNESVGGWVERNGCRDVILEPTARGTSKISSPQSSRLPQSTTQRSTAF